MGEKCNEKGKDDKKILGRRQKEKMSSAERHRAEMKPSKENQLLFLATGDALLF